MARPNILLVMTDEQCADAMSCAGNPHLHTPAMDSLASRGVCFQKAYVTQPLCIPCRTALQMGCWPHQNGIMVNRQDQIENGRMFPMLGSVMRRGGYDCAYFGKWHISINRPDKPWHISIDDEDAAIHGYDPAEGTKDREIPDRVSEFLAADRDRPFFLTASFVNPHDCIEFADGRPTPQGELPPVPHPDQCPPLPDNFGVPKDEPSVIRAVQQRYPNSYPVGDWDEGRWRQYIWGYYRLVEMVDAHIGRLLEALRSSGREEDTVIIFTADHGDGAGHHRWNQKQTLYDECVRVPFIACVPGAGRSNTVDRTNLVSSIDIAPTLLDYASVERPSHVEGHSLRELIETGTPSAPSEYVVSETLFGTGTDIPGWGGRMVRSARWKYVVYDHGDRREQLFDMDTDPGEMHNLAKDPACAKELKRHRQWLKEWCQRTGDSFVGVS